MDLAEFKKEFEPIFRKHLAICLQEMRLRLNDKLLQSYIEQAAHIALTGGKRARPFFMYAMYGISGGKKKNIAMRTAVAIELFHVFCLIHDDITDRGILRHGEKTIHEYVLNNLKKAKRRGDLAHIAESQAMLAGDLVYAWAYERLAGITGVEERVRIDALEVFNAAMQDVIAGQMIDIDQTTKETTTDATLLKKMELKTASYTFIHPLELGATLAGASKEARVFCRSFGKVMGLAFQLQDDVLDVVGDPKHLGKQPFGDIQEGQHTLLSQYVLRHAEKHDRDFFKQKFGTGKLTVHDAARIKKIYLHSGAIAEAKRNIAEYIEHATMLIASAPITKKGKGYLVGLVQGIASRSM